MNIKKDLIQFFEETGWSKQKLADESGVSYMTIRRIVGEDGTRQEGCRSFQVYERLHPFLYGDKYPGPKKAA
ncbi:hypothetical protein [uncultured Pseudodesulfovibrio sp.]|uniref:hypothetical protein n=1 Tax=uncultured Pseudodesulfovibrio sp. TaxID=2035858 RepID=UPI0029C65AAE|nr:hypothetical protein [uncultured Pseudodesulfovibrio sp.]